jgi:hypothetical protein
VCVERLFDAVRGSGIESEPDGQEVSSAPMLGTQRSLEEKDMSHEQTNPVAMIATETAGLI